MSLFQMGALLKFISKSTSTTTTIVFSEENYMKYTKKDTILHNNNNYSFPNEGETRTYGGPIWQVLIIIVHEGIPQKVVFTFHCHNDDKYDVKFRLLQG